MANPEKSEKDPAWKKLEQEIARKRQECLTNLSGKRSKEATGISLDIQNENLKKLRDLSYDPEIEIYWNDLGTRQACEKLARSAEGISKFTWVGIIKILSGRSKEDKEKYIDALIKLSQRCIDLENSWVILRDLGFDKALSEKYVSNLTKMFANGIDIADGETIRWLELKWGEDDHFINNMIRLYNAKLPFLEYPYGADDHYVDLYIQKKGFEPGAKRKYLLGIEKLPEKTVEALFGSEGYEISVDLENERMNKKNQLSETSSAILADIRERCNDISFRDLEESHPDKWSNEDYKKNLATLALLGIRIDERFVKEFPLELGINPDYIAGLKQLHFECLDLSSTYFSEAFFEGFTLEKAKSKEFFKALAFLVNEGFNIDHYFVESLHLDVAKNPKCLANLKRLKDNGVYENNFFLNDISYEKLSNDKYIDNLIALSKFTDGKHNAWILNLELEDGTNDLCLEGFRKINGAGLKVDYIDSAKIKDPKYVDIYLRLKSTERDTDSAYLLEVQKIPAEQISKIYSQNGIEEIEKIRKTTELTPLADHILKVLEKDLNVFKKRLDAFADKIAANPEIANSIFKLRLAGVSIYEEDLVSGGSGIIEKLKNDIYVKNMIRIHDAAPKFIENSRSRFPEVFVTALSLEKGVDETYVNNIIYLAENGFLFDKDIIEALTPDKVKSRKYVENLCLLAKKGIGIYAIIIKEDLTREAGESDRYIQGVMDLKDSSLIHYRLPEYAKAINPTYRAALKKLKILVGTNEYKDFSLEKGLSNAYLAECEKHGKPGMAADISYLVDVQKIPRDVVDAIYGPNKSQVIAEIREKYNLDSVSLAILEGEERYFSEGKRDLKESEFEERLLTPEKAEDKKYMANLYRLISAHEHIDVKDLSLEMGSDDAYINGFFWLKNQGIDITFNEYIHSFEIQNGRNQDYLAHLVELYNLGIRNERTFRESYMISPQKTQNEGYIKNIKKLKAVIPNCNSNYILSLTLEKGRNDQYVNSLMKLENAGIRTKPILTYLDLGEGLSETYIDGLIVLYENGFKIDEYLLKVLEMEKGASKKYIDTLIKIKTAGKVNVTVEFIKSLILEKVEDDGYLRLLLEETEKSRDNEFHYRFEEIDKRYLIEISHIPKEHVDALYGYSSEKAPEAYALFLTLLSNNNQSQLSPLAVKLIEPRVRNLALNAAAEISSRVLRHEDPQAIMDLIKDFDLGQLFGLFVYGREELMRTTTGPVKVVYAMIKEKMAAQGMDALDFLNLVDPQRMHSKLLLSLFSEKNILDDFLSTIPEDKQERKEQILREFITDIQDGNEINNGIAIYEAISSLRLNNSKLSPALEKELEKAHKFSEDKKRAIYGIIASMYVNANKNVSQEPDIKEFFANMAKEYPIKSVESVSLDRLVNKKGEIIQQYFYYDDEDGQSSFDHMVNTYRNDPDWTIIGQDNKEQPYIVIKSRRIHGRQIIKFANKPDKPYEGNEAIKTAMEGMDISKLQVVQRGHITHVRKTVEHIKEGTPIVFLGACGGFSETEAVLEISPDAYIIATKRTGSKFVNDPLLKIIDEEMLAAKDKINWNIIWEKANRDPRVSKTTFADYINPALSASVTLIGALKKYYKESKKE